MKTIAIIIGVLACSLCGFDRCYGLDTVHFKATLVLQLPDTVVGNQTLSRTFKVKVTTRDILKLSADALGYPDTTFGTGRPVRLGIVSSLATPGHGNFLILDESGENVVLDLGAALAQITTNGNPGYFRTDHDPGVYRGYVTHGQPRQKYVHSCIAYIDFYDGGPADGTVHAFHFIGLQTSTHDYRYTSYHTARELHGAGEAGDRIQGNTIGVFTSVTYRASGSGAIP